MKKKMIVRIIICFLAMMSFMCLTAEAKAKRQQVKGNAMSKYLDRQIQTCNAKKLLEVVESKYATENHLMSVAEIVADYDKYRFITKKEAIKLVKALIKNKKCTSKVLKELIYSHSFEIYLMVAESEKCDEETLELLARIAGRYKEDGDYTKKEAIKLAKALIKNKKCTNKVLKELIYSYSFEISLMVAKSKKCNEGTLKLLAGIIALYEYGGYPEKEAIKLAKAIIKNKKCTSKVLKKLIYSHSFEICLMLAAKSKKCNEGTLKFLAENVLRYRDWGYTEKEAIKIAKAIIKNKKCTNKVLTELKYL